MGILRITDLSSITSDVYQKIKQSKKTNKAKKLQTFLGVLEFTNFRYKAFRDENGTYTLFYWHLLAIRLAFVIIFEHFVFGVCRLIDILVPDVPESLSLKMRRERYLAKQALADTEAMMQVSTWI